MILKVGVALPDAVFQLIGKEGLPEKVTTDDVFAGKKVVAFAVPGAFTKVCTKMHLPSYVNNVKTFREKGFDHIVCIAVNDAFTLHAWGELNGVKDYDILMLSDGNADFTRAVGMQIDASELGMGLRSKRYAMIVENKVVKQFYLEEKPNSFKVSGAEHVLTHL